MPRLHLVIMAIICCAGCSSAPRGPYTPITETSRNTAEAERLNREAIEVIETDPEQAERLLREALTADLWHGPSHNSLGVLALNKGSYYEAANEFEWARKLMPGHPDPRMNLALTLERAGRFEEALAEYDSALDVHPSHLPTMQAIARLQLRRNLADDRTANLLSDIALRGEPEWRDWARRQASASAARSGN